MKKITPAERTLRMYEPTSIQREEFEVLLTEEELKLIKDALYLSANLAADSKFDKLLQDVSLMVHKLQEIK